MSTAGMLISAGGALWAVVFLMIVWKPIVNPKYRRVVLRMEIWKVLTIGIAWPFICIGIFVGLIWYLNIYNPFKKDNNDIR